MRPTSFDPSVLRRQLRQCKIANLPELKRILGTDTDLTVYRKLRQLDYLASYTHRGRFYTLTEIARFDDHALWSHEAVWFSRYGTLLATVEAFVNGSANGYYAPELADALHAEVQEPLRHLVQMQRLSRIQVDGQFLYTTIDSVERRKQTLARRNAQAVSVAVHAAALELSPDELKAAILLFYSLLDEQQRRLFGGLESIRLGMAGIPCWAIFWVWTCITSPVATSNCWIGMWSAGESAAPAAAASQRKKNAGHNHRPAFSAGARCGWRSHDRPALVAPYYHHHRRGVGPTVQLGIPVSPYTVARLLHQMGYSLRVNHKQIATTVSPDRNLQFEYLAELRHRFRHRHLPIVSVDSKKRELVGNFKNPGRHWECAPRRVYDHDFRTDSIGVAIPYGIYDVHENRGALVSAFLTIPCLCRSCHRPLVAAGRFPALLRFTPTADSGRYRRQ